MVHNHQSDRTSIDLLPPFGEPEVTTRGDHADELALLGLAIVVGIALASIFG